MLLQVFQFQFPFAMAIVCSMAFLWPITFYMLWVCVCFPLALVFSFPLLSHSLFCRTILMSDSKQTAVCFLPWTVAGRSRHVRRALSLIIKDFHFSGLFLSQPPRFFFCLRTWPREAKNEQRIIISSSSSPLSCLHPNYSTISWLHRNMRTHFFPLLAPFLCQAESGCCYSALGKWYDAWQQGEK